MQKLILPFFLLSLLFFSLFSLSGAASDQFSTYVGASQFDSIKASVVLDDGSIIVVGHSNSPDFPTTDGAFDETCGTDTACGGGFLIGDAFVTKFSADGSLVFSTFIGGDEDDAAHDVAVAADGTIVVVGYTKSTDFPTTAGAFDQTYNEPGGSAFGDGFIAKLSDDGSQLLYSTYIGSDIQDEVLKVAVQNNDVYFAGFTSSSDFPTTNGAFDTAPNGSHDVFVGKLSTDGSHLTYSTFIGGDAFESVHGIAINGAGEVTIAGQTQSSNFPTTSGAADTVMGGSSEGFVLRLTSPGTDLIYSTLIGGSSSDSVSDLVLDETGQAYVIGTTLSTDFDATPGAFDTEKSNLDDGFFSIINESGTAILYTTFTNLVSSGRYSGVAIDLEDDDTVFLGLSISETGSFGQREPGFLWLDPAGNGADDLLLDCRQCYRFDEGDLTDLDVGLNGVVLVGETNDEDFTVSSGAFDTSFNGDFDGFLINQITPKTEGVDATLELPEITTAPPTSTVGISINYGNVGATTANNVQITVTLAAELTYVSDTSGAIPQQNGNQFTWSLNEIPFGGSESFSVLVQLPDAAIGETYSVSAEIGNSGPETITANNSDSMNILIANPIFLPVILR